MCSLGIAVDPRAAVNNIKTSRVAMETTMGSLCTVVELQNISYCHQQYECSEVFT
jgi:hypothetical protein